MDEVKSRLQEYMRVFDEVSMHVHSDVLNEAIMKVHRIAWPTLARLSTKGLGDEARQRLEEQLESALEHAREAWKVVQEEVITVSCNLLRDGVRLLHVTGPKEITSGVDDFVLVELRNLSGKERKIGVSIEAEWWLYSWARRVDVELGEEKRFLLRVKGHKAGKLELRLVLRDFHKLGEFPFEVDVLDWGRLKCSLSDAGTKKATAARVSVKGSNGRYYFPQSREERPTHHDQAFDFFYADGGFDLIVPSGPAEVTVQKGIEYVAASRKVEVPARGRKACRIGLKRWANSKEMGWYSGDSHLQYVTWNWRVNADWDEMDMMRRAEDIDVAHVLPLKHHWQGDADLVAVRPNLYPPGVVEEYSGKDWLTVVGEEYRNEEFYGHMVFWNVKELVQPVSTGWMGGPEEVEYPSNSQACDEVHNQGGYASPAHDIGGEAPVLAATGKIDLVDAHGPERWYDLLNCGFRLPLEIGSDYPANVFGFARVYVHVGKKLSYEGWLKSLVGGKTFVSSGAIIFFEVEGKEPGETVQLRADGGGELKIRATAKAARPLKNLEVVYNGEVIARTSGRKKELSLEETVKVPRSGWLAARCSPSDQTTWWGQADVAHTSAVYVDVEDKPFASPESADRMIAIIDSTVDRIEKHAVFLNDEQRGEVLELFAKGRRVYEVLKRKAFEMGAAGKVPGV